MSKKFDLVADCRASKLDKRLRLAANGETLDCMIMNGNKVLLDFLTHIYETPFPFSPIFNIKQFS